MGMHADDAAGEAVDPYWGQPAGYDIGYDPGESEADRVERERTNMLADASAVYRKAFGVLAWQRIKPFLLKLTHDQLVTIRQMPEWKELVKHINQETDG